MRIIAGEWRGRKITAPKGETTRPTADRTRETLFSMLTSRLGTFEGLSVGDMFAGSGALGLEALSRGAAHCLFVEQEEQALKAIRANIAAFGAREKSDVRAASVMGLGSARQPLDLIMLDPPYDTGAGMVALDKMQRQGWINEATWIALETGLKEDVSVKNFEIDVERKVGKAKITLLRLSEA
ncbi:16S rRNA (guanine(966)-N(2))-methyltransferase RsmD [Pontixanthobacter luteolus]|uniref:16S rRNA (guanine(966)-N(2))-methyltransferase RsmD n=1 Tax=Pontixanthobacter luteolus TaxID=295089 RepID=UPI002304BEC2|nr:16S rRNA (guanine(966)-N(2))-methyltransferase RsmD [Pontixanthobacter luteolus]